MKLDRVGPDRRRPTNLSLPESLLDEAKALGVNISRACEVGLAAELKREREARWLNENRAAIEEYNDWVEENGLPLDHHRKALWRGSTST